MNSLAKDQRSIGSDRKTSEEPLFNCSTVQLVNSPETNCSPTTYAFHHSRDRGHRRVCLQSYSGSGGRHNLAREHGVVLLSSGLVFVESLEGWILPEARRKAGVESESQPVDVRVRPGVLIHHRADMPVDERNWCLLLPAIRVRCTPRLLRRAGGDIRRSDGVSPVQAHVPLL